MKYEIQGVMLPTEARAIFGEVGGKMPWDWVRVEQYQR